MKKDYLKGTAIFMMALIITIPIYSTSALAKLSRPRLYGYRDGIQNAIKRDDTVVLNVTAYISGDNDITASQVRRTGLGGPPFHSCTNIGSGFFDCTYMMSSFEVSANQNKFEIEVNLYKDNNAFEDRAILVGVFDDYAPEIRSFNITPAYTSGGDITLQYNIHDHYYGLNDDQSRCSGIKRIEFSSPGRGVFRNITLNPPYACDKADSITVPVSDITNSTGIIDVTLRAFDLFNQVSSKVSQFTYDTAGPVINANSLSIKDNNGNSIDYIGSNPLNGIISFEITSDDLNTNNVYGDISSVNVANPPGYNNKKASCSHLSSGGYRCTFSSIQVKLNQSTNVNIIISASDIAGNSVSATLTKNIAFDGVGPVVNAIRTTKVYGEVSYVTSSLNTFVVEMTEAGDIDTDKIRSDLSNIRTGLNNVAANSCSKSGTTWTCYWNNTASDKPDGVATVSVLSSSTDRLGNSISGTLSGPVTIDKTPPVVISASVTGVGTGSEAFTNRIKTGDSLSVILSARELNALEAYADFSLFVTTQDNVSGSCSKSGTDNWNCTWLSDPIDVPGHIISNINFNAKDFVGNSVSYAKSVEVYWLQNAPNVSYWASRVECSPDLVDRQTTPLINTRVYCRITLIPTTADQETLSINLGTCQDRYNNSLGYTENIGLLNAEAGSTDPYLAIDLIQGEMTTDKLQLMCPLQIVSRAGTTINQQPEIEPVNININFYNMPLGEYGEGIEDKIEDAKDDALKGIWEIIGFLRLIVKWAQLICRALGMINKIKLLFQSFTGTITGAHLASYGPPAEPILAAAKSVSCIEDAKLGQTVQESYITLNPICKFVNCQMSPNTDKTKKGTGTFGQIADSITQGNWFTEYMDWQIALPTGGGGKMVTGKISEVVGKQYYQYANARDNLLVAIVTGCIPGIINGLDKYRQILCLYADCLEQNAYNNIPVKTCDDQKSYAMCKYIWGEIFAVIPWTALFDFYIGMVRNALSDPLSAIGIPLAMFCRPTCEPTKQGSSVWMFKENWCNYVTYISVAGEVFGDVMGIIDDFKQTKQDYCARLEDEG